jgi:plastocyanin
MRIHGRTAMAVLVGGVLALQAGLTGCKPSEAVRQSDGGVAPEGRTPGVRLDPATLGTAAGTVHFAGKAPAPVKIDMSMDPVCSITADDNFSQQYVVDDGKLANVYVYIKSGPHDAMTAVAPPSPPVVMDQIGCKYAPHVVAIVQGGSVEFRNSDGTMHNVHTMPMAEGSRPIDISEGAKGAPQTKQINQPEAMIPVRCNNHPWMNAFVNVSATPFFAVTGSDGHFSISGLPAGTYTLAAVHEKMGEQTITITVDPGATAKADFTFRLK